MAGQFNDKILKLIQQGKLPPTGEEPQEAVPVRPRLPAQAGGPGGALTGGSPAPPPTMNGGTPPQGSPMPGGGSAPMRPPPPPWLMQGMAANGAVPMMGAGRASPPAAMPAQPMQPPMQAQQRPGLPPYQPIPGMPQ